MSELKLVSEPKTHPIDIFVTWVPRIGIVLVFLLIGVTKFNDDPKGEWFKIFERIGWGQWFRYVTGGVQVTGALLLLTPWTRTAGAAMLVSTMAGAMVVDIVVLRSPGYALLPFVLLCAVVVTALAGRLR